MLWSCYRYYFPLKDLHLKRRKVNPAIRLVSRSILTQSWGREQKPGLSSPWQSQDWKQRDKTPQSGSEADWFWFKSLKIEFLIAIGTTRDVAAWPVLCWAPARAVCELCHDASTALSLPGTCSEGQGCCSITPALPALGRLWGALLYVTRCVTTFRAQPCKRHGWPPNARWKGTDMSPSPNSSLVSHVQGRHELEEIMVKWKILR